MLLHNLKIHKIYIQTDDTIRISARNRYRGTRVPGSLIPITRGIFITPLLSSVNSTLPLWLQILIHTYITILK